MDRARQSSSELLEEVWAGSGMQARAWNEYIPHQAEIVDIDVESWNTYLLTLKFLDGTLFDYKPGQFAMISLFGVGECPISLASSPTREALQLCIRQAGHVTKGILDCRIGDVLGVRGPYGNGFPVERMKKDVVIVGGGLGFATLRSLVNYIMDRREHFGRVVVAYGAKARRDMYFTHEFTSWVEADIEVGLTVDVGDESWRGRVGLVTSVLDDLDVGPGSAAVCGPGVMIHSTATRLLERGFKESDIYVSLERHMKCGVGRCEHCVMGPCRVCVDGPVFTYDKARSVL